MTKEDFFSDADRSVVQRKPGRRGAVHLAMSTALFISVWINYECCSLRREQQAVETLERDYHANIHAHHISSCKPDWRPSVDWRELRFGRMYVPVNSVSFNQITIDRRAWEQLACFRHLEWLAFQDCRLEGTVAFGTVHERCLRDLRFVQTPIGSGDLRSISRLSHLEGLWFNAADLKGDWLHPISLLPRLERLIVERSDFSDGATDSLARMKELKWLQLSHARVDSKLGPALASLDKLECLLLDHTSFNDEGIKHLTSLKRLKQLHLAHTSITDAGMESVAQLVNLWRLSIDYTKVSDVGLRHLSHLHELAGLDIVGTRTTNLCLRTLAGMPSLKSVLVWKTGISTSSPGFVGVLGDDYIWYPNQTRAKEAEENSKGAGCSDVED